MIGWEREPFELINEGLFRVTSPGPLHAPIDSFSIRRNEKLDLILETRAPADAQSSAPEIPSGTVRLNTDAVELTNIAGIRAVLSGIQPYSVNKSHHYEKNQHVLTEESRVHRIDAVIDGGKTPAYTIDWLDNVPHFHWPDTIRTDVSTITTRRIAENNDGITLTSSEGREGFGRHAAKLAVAGTNAFLCALDREEAAGRLRPGCIIYLGSPDDEFRKRVRNALSFALGAFLVDLGSVAYTDEWEVQSFRLNSAYSIGRRVFDLPVLHPAPLHMNWQHGIDRLFLNRIVNSIIGKYDELDFGNLAWAYWHALCATPHIAGVHFGAAIEALQRRYITANPTKVQTKIIADRAIWTKFNDEIDGVIAQSKLPEESKSALRQNVGSLNKVHQKAKMDALLRDIGIVLGPEEALAWKRRNDAAHGNEMEAGGELSLIQDNRLLKVVFHRMLLRITNASDLYFDYATPGFPMRRLADPASSGI
ncbi:hypothetical protein FXB40_34135 [Bradyrhizobium rifense]|uniref:ApeA N-terminal domain-containing protein n=1 Tax=Bradyrhizobium rifense TaxID=515499 RepID=A0A5D3KGW4_9BRAD|nr:hypothetical protein [Bradyrhizobium rifense]TYL89970.1 hypothetical protein FXB40_34135 [Bradyrhizobium rifense]